MSEASKESLTEQRAVNFDTTAFADQVCTDGDQVIIVSGEIDLSTAPKLWEALALLIERGHREVVLDLGGVEFIDSQGIAVLARAHQRLAPEGGAVVVRAPREQARKVFEISGLASLIRLED